MPTSKKVVRKADEPAVRARAAARRPAGRRVSPDGADDDGAVAPSAVTPAVALRRLPAQARGREAFERVLHAAARLIEEGGIEKLNTNRVASESGTNISTVYKYFPNKLAIVATLFRRQNEERAEVAFRELDALPHAPEWGTVVDRTIDRLLELRRGQAGAMALRAAMRGSAELMVLEQQAVHYASTRLAVLIRQRSRLSPARALRVARFVVETEMAIMDWWHGPEGRFDPAIARELKVLMRSYLGLYLLPEPAPRA